MSHIGIRIRLSVPAGVIYDCTSDMAHYQAQMGALGGPWCSPSCLPGCDKHGWKKLIAGFTGDLKVEIKAVMLEEIEDVEATEVGAGE